MSWLALEGNASVNFPSMGGAMPLHIASVEGHLRICQARSARPLLVSAC